MAEPIVSPADSSPHPSPREPPSLAPPPPSIADRLAAVSPALLLLRLSGRVEIGSSTLVRVGHRFLLATAGHTIDDAGDHEIRVVPSGRTAAEPLPFLRRSRPRRGDDDLAWVELAAETVARHRLGFVELAAVGAGAPGDAGERCFLVQGYPAERTLAASLDGFDLRARGFVTVAAAARPGDVAVLYPPPAAAEELPAPHPYGISGGGIWTCPRGPAAVGWEGATRLVGVARGWRPRRNTLYGTPIELWLRRVAADFPDLRSGLDRHRPRG